MNQRMTAEVLFLDPNDARRGINELVDHGFEIEVLHDWIDDVGPTVFLFATISTELEWDGFFSWVSELVDRFGRRCF